MFFLFNPPWGWNVLEAERLLYSWRHIDWRNTKICIHRASRMEQKFGKCWKSSIFEGKLQVFISYLSEWNENSQYVQSLFFILALFTACFYHFLPWRSLNSSMTRFLLDILLPFPNSNDLNSRGKSNIQLITFRKNVNNITLLIFITLK